MKTQTFGIEIETTGLGRKRTAEAIAQYFGTTAQHIGAHLDDFSFCRILMTVDSCHTCLLPGEGTPASVKACAI